LSTVWKPSPQSTVQTKTRGRLIFIVDSYSTT
jgi:hypothetical protein